MKKLLTILLILFSFSVSAQVDTIKVPIKGFGGSNIDTSLFVKKGDRFPLNVGSGLVAIDSNTIAVDSFNLHELRYSLTNRDTTDWNDTTLIDKKFLSDRNSGVLNKVQSDSSVLAAAINSKITQSLPLIGSVYFSDGTFTIAQDNNNLYWDNTKKSLVIGGNTVPFSGPYYRLNITTADEAATFVVNAPTSSTSGRAFMVTATGDIYGRTLFYSNGFTGYGLGISDRDVFFGHSSTANTLLVAGTYSGSGTGNLDVSGRMRANQFKLLSGISMLDSATAASTYQSLITKGTATLASGTVTVSTSAVTATSKITVTVNTPGGTQGFLSVPTRTTGTSFVINSTSATETSTVDWTITN